MHIKYEYKKVKPVVEPIASASFDSIHGTPCHINHLTNNLLTFNVNGMVATFKLDDVKQIIDLLLEFEQQMEDNNK